MMRRGLAVLMVLVAVALLACMASAALAQAVVAAPAGVVAAAPVLACTDVPCEHVIALAPTAPAAERPLLDLRQATTTKAIDLRDARLEYGPVVANAGAGGAVSWLVAQSAKRKAWVDVGALKTDADWHGLLGISTNCPIGGQRVQARTAFGVGILTDGEKIGYTRVRLRF